MGNCHYKGTMGNSHLCGELSQGCWELAGRAEEQHSWLQHSVHFPLLSLQLAFAQHQAEMAKMGQFDKVCAEKLEWYGSLVGKFLSWYFAVVVKITKYQSIVSQDTLISSWVVRGILFNTWLHGFILFPSRKTLFSRPGLESWSQHCTWGMPWCYFFFL